jgi:hypothetical protein
MAFPDLLLGAAAGAAAGLVSCHASAWAVLSLRRGRNRRLLAAGLPTGKDEVYAPPRALAAVMGGLGGGLVGALGGSILAGALVGLAIPLLTVVAALIATRGDDGSPLPPPPR